MCGGMFWADAAGLTDNTMPFQPKSMAPTPAGAGGATPTPMGEDAPTQAGTPPSDQGKESVFLTRDQLGGQQVKPGDTVSFTVKDVDPQTGEVEVTPGGSDGFDNGKPAAKTGPEEAFDKLPD